MKQKPTLKRKYLQNSGLTAATAIALMTFLKEFADFIHTLIEIYKAFN